MTEKRFHLCLQAELQKRMLEQQDIARKQQERQMQAMLEAQQQMMQSQFSSPIAVPQVSFLMFASQVNGKSHYASLIYFMKEIHHI